MSRIDISVLSTEYLRMKVWAKENGSFVDPTDSPVEMALLTTVDASPEEEDWHNAEWETAGGTHYARLMVGPESPGSIELVQGDIYRLWVRINTGDEVPVAGLGWVHVY